jgi:hypothetical protein
MERKPTVLLPSLVVTVFVGTGFVFPREVIEDAVPGGVILDGIIQGISVERTDEVRESAHLTESSLGV